jgi:hypothetical protein
MSVPLLHTFTSILINRRIQEFTNFYNKSTLAASWLIDLSSPVMSPTFSDHTNPQVASGPTVWPLRLLYRSLFCRRYQLAFPCFVFLSRTT